jgi:uncharacterized protein (DUF302 family)
MRSYFVFLYFLLLTPVTVWAQSEYSVGLINVTSSNSAAKTIDLLKSAIDEAGLTLIAEIDHAEAADKNELALRPTYVLLFGNPKVGTKLMQADQRVGLYLPLRMLVWENTQGQVFIGYHDPIELTKVYQLEGEKEILQKMRGMLANLAKKASQANGK